MHWATLLFLYSKVAGVSGGLWSLARFSESVSIILPAYTELMFLMATSLGLPQISRIRCSWSTVDAPGMMGLPMNISAMMQPRAQTSTPLV